VITDLGVLDVAGDGFHLVELAPGVTAHELVASTAALVRVPPFICPDDQSIEDASLS
jgi:3-oxoacid CoA-transferase subunit B